MKFLKTSLLYLLLPCFLVAQSIIPPKPTSKKDQTSVYDYAKVLLDEDADRLKYKLLRYADSTSTQIVIITTLTTEGENINYLAAQWGEKWGIGQKNKDNGVLLLLAKNDKQFAISTGNGVQHLLTDALSKRIIENIIIPEFKKGNYYGGLDRGTSVIIDVLEGTFKEDRSFEEQPSIFFSLIGFLIILIIIYLFWKARNNQNGNDKNGGSPSDSIWETIILSNMGRNSGSSWGGSSGGSFGGGSFGGGFGGGGFSGGGASGGW